MYRFRLGFGTAFTLMVGSALFEGFWKSYLPKGPYTDHQAFVYGSIQTCITLTYWLGQIIWTAEIVYSRKKD